MQTIIQSLKTEVCQIINTQFQLSLNTLDIGIEPTNPDFEGDCTILLFPLVKLKIGNPQQIGEIIANHLTAQTKLVSQWNIVKGFLNISLSEHVWHEEFAKFLQSGEQAFRTQIGSGKKVMVEFSSPNTNKPLHLGHIRNIFLGFSLSNILQANGYEVIKANLINDRGVHICKSMLAWQLLGKGETPESSGIKGDHLVGKYYVIYDQEFKKEYAEWQNSDEAVKILANYLQSDKALKLIQQIQTKLKLAKEIDGVLVNYSEEVIENQAKEQVSKEFWSDYKDTYGNQYSVLGLQTREMLRKWEENDPKVRELWQKMNTWVFAGFNESYERMGVSFDKIYLESNTYLLGKQWVEKGLLSGVFYQKEDGSVWADLTDVGLDHKIVLRSDGTSVYITQDIGTAYLKYEDFGLDKSVYVIGNEQDYHMKVLIAICKKLGLPCAEGMYHLSYGMVELPSGKMKSREGTVVDADDLMDVMENTAKELTDELGKTSGLSVEEVEKLHKIIALGALKYFLLKVEPVKKMLFNPSESIDLKGHTGSYIQYNHARIRSVLRKAQMDGWQESKIETSYSIQAQEKTLLKHLFNFQNVIKEAAEQYNPSILAAWCYETAKDYSKFWNDLSVLGGKPEEKNFRLIISQKIAEGLQMGMKLLGIDCPDRM